MSLSDWHKNGWLKTVPSNKKQIAELFGIVERDLEDAETDGLSHDWKFGIAYNAALKLCTILLRAEGYLPEKGLAHYRTLQALPLILGKEVKTDADYLETCRVKRNVVEYDRSGAASQEEAEELHAFCKELREKVIAWLKKTHPDLNPYKA